MFEINDFVITKSSGICKITNKEKGLDGDTVYVLKPWGEKETVVRIPYESGELVRRVMDKDQAEELVDRIPYITTLKIPRKGLSETIFSSAMNQWDAVEWVKVLKTAYFTQQERRLTDIESSMADTAKKYLHSELSLVLEIPYHEVDSFIQNSVKNNF